MTFYCAVALASYGPEPDPAPTSTSATLERCPLRDANSTTPDICPNGTREDLVDFGATLSVLFVPFSPSPLPQQILKRAQC